jgi:hypothetical protein|tara:strand:+ start:327 stop:617 length:291 start_codon:yes stop_codon:yes gene_type:complete
MANWLGGYRVTTNHIRTVSTGSAQTSATNAGTEYVRVTSDTASVFIEFGANPTASVTTSIRLCANEPQIFKIDGGMKLAAILASGTGNVFMSELSE